MSALLWLMAILVGALLLGAIFQAAGSAIDRRRHPAPGRYVAVNGMRLHVHSQGEGEPAIVLESGIATSSLNWRGLQSQLARATRVIAYDRAGFGWSDPAQTPRTMESLVSEFTGMIAALDVRGPLIIVAHSFGSLIARSFCALHPERTAGLVLLDPIDCEHWRALPVEDKSELALAERFARRGVWLAHLGVIRFTLLLLSGGARTLPKGIARATSGKAAGVISRITGEVGKMPPAIWPAVRSHWSRPQSFRTLAEYFAALTACVRQVGYKTLGDIPITVISAANASPSELAEHRKLAGLSTQGEHIVAESSGHWIHLDRPDLVIAAVQRCHPQRWRSAG